MWVKRMEEGVKILWEKVMGVELVRRIKKKEEVKWGVD